MAVAPRYQGDALPNEDRDHTDDKLVDRLFVKKGRDDLTASHQPDILARLLPKTTHKRTYRILHELHAWRGVGW